MKPLAAVLASSALLLGGEGFCASPIDYSGGTYSQDFDGLPSSGPDQTFTGFGPFDVPGVTDWEFAKVSGSNPDSLFKINNGAANSGALYSYGSTDSTDRALGALGSGSGAYQFGFTLVNTTGTTLTSFSLDYLGEQWRYGGSNPDLNTLVFSYGLGATSITTGSFIDVPELTLNPPITEGTAGALDGNLAENQAAISFSVTSILWEPGSTLTLRWTDADTGGSDDGLAVDDLSFSALSSSFDTLVWNAPGGTWDTTAGNWAGGGIYANGDIVQFLDGAQGVVNVDAGGVTPLQVQVGNTSGTYTFQGGPITGGGSLIKSGAGLLEIDTEVNLSGGIFVEGGTLRTLDDDLLSDTATLTVGEGAMVDLGENFETIGGLVLQGGTLAASSSGFITIDGGVSVLASASTAVMQGVVTSSAAPINFSVADGAAAVDLRVEAQFFGGLRMIFGGTGTTELLGDNSTFTGGVTLNTGTLLFGSGNVLGTGSFFFNGGTIRSTAEMTGASAIGTQVSVGGNVVVDATGGDIEFANFASFFGSASKTMEIVGNVTITGDITGTSVINKTGTGLLTIAGLDDSAGRTTVQQGTLKLASTANFTNTGFIRVDSGATFDASEYGSTLVIQRVPASGEDPEIVQELNGGGLLLAPVSGVQVDGVLAPGALTVDSLTQTLTINGGPVTLTSSGDFVFQIASDILFDKLQMDGVLTLEGDLVLSLLDGFAPGGSDSFTIVSAGSIDGMFANVDGDGRIAFAEGSFLVTQSGSDIVLSDFAAIPEPGVLALLGIGGGFVVLMLRRKQS